VSQAFDFRGGARGWRAGFADYPAGEEAFYELQAGIHPLPARLGGGPGYYVQGNNHSNDLFMFLKRRLGPEDGIETGRRYLVALTVRYASAAPLGGFGIGGAPGESVVLKAGAAAVEPLAIPGEGGLLHLNADKGAQGTGGAAASVVGSIANGDAGGEARFVAQALCGADGVSLPALPTVQKQLNEFRVGARGRLDAGHLAVHQLRGRGADAEGVQVNPQVAGPVARHQDDVLPPALGDAQAGRGEHRLIQDQFLRLFRGGREVGQNGTPVCRSRGSGRGPGRVGNAMLRNSLLPGFLCQE
jgi:hypothetical protein